MATPFPPRPRHDFGRAPRLVFLELTRACDLRCPHCRAEAQACPDPREMRTGEVCALLERLADFGGPQPDGGMLHRPLVVLTGGDPFKRHDLESLVRFGAGLGMQMALTPSATPLVTPERLQKLKDAGLARLAVSVDGAAPATHDAFRGLAGAYDLSWQILRWGRAAGLSLQVNTTVRRGNAHELPALAAQLEAMGGLDLWSVFFLVPTGRARAEDMLDAAGCESVFAFLFEQALRRPYAIKTTEAQHFRRFVAQQAQAGRSLKGTPSHLIHAMPRAIRDGQGVMFVSHTGAISPSGFLPHDCGVFPEADPVAVYRGHPLFTRLRDQRTFEGKCGRCEYGSICGGSRARACALTGSPYGSDPTCLHEPRAA